MVFPKSLAMHGKMDQGRIKNVRLRWSLYLIKPLMSLILGLRHKNRRLQLTDIRNKGGGIEYLNLTQGSIRDGVYKVVGSPQTP